MSLSRFLYDCKTDLVTSISFHVSYALESPRMLVKNTGSWTPALESAVSVRTLVTELTWGNGALDRSYLPLQPHQPCDSGIIINCF